MAWAGAQARIARAIAQPASAALPSVESGVSRSRCKADTRCLPQTTPQWCGHPMTKWRRASPSSGVTRVWNVTENPYRLRAVLAAGVAIIEDLQRAGVRRLR